MITEIRKRDGAIEPFNERKIVMAITKALIQVDAATKENLLIAENIAERIGESDFTEPVDVEKIQDLVEDGLMKSDLCSTAKAYIKYREKRTQERNRNNELNRKIEDVLLCRHAQNQNANVDEHSFGGRKYESANILHKNIALNAFIRPQVAQAHRESRIYIHDLSEYDIGDHNCLFADVGKLLRTGFSTRNGDVRPAGSFATACQLVAVIFQVQSQVQFGGVASCHLDYDLAPYVKKSFYKHYEDGLRFLHRWGLEEIEEWMNPKKEKSLPVNDIVFMEHDRAYDYAVNMLEREGEEAAQSLYHNLNTLESRAGSQIPFTSINFGTDTSPEGRLVQKWLLEASLDGIGAHHTTPIFPISIFKYKKGVSANPEDPNYDLKKLAIQSLSKRIYPNIVNCDWSQNLTDPENPDTEMATMGYRVAHLKPCEPTNVGCGVCR